MFIDDLRCGRGGRIVTPIGEGLVRVGMSFVISIGMSESSVFKRVPEGAKSKE